MGSVPQAIIAAPQIYQGIKDIRAGNYAQGGVGLGLGILGVKGLKGESFCAYE